MRANTWLGRSIGALARTEPEKIAAQDVYEERIIGSARSHREKLKLIRLHREQQGAKLIQRTAAQEVARASTGQDTAAAAEAERDAARADAEQARNTSAPPRQSASRLAEFRRQLEEQYSKRPTLRRKLDDLDSKLDDLHSKLAEQASALRLAPPPPRSEPRQAASRRAALRRQRKDALRRELQTRTQAAKKITAQDAFEQSILGNRKLSNEEKNAIVLWYRAPGGREYMERLLKHSRSSTLPLAPAEPQPHRPT
jgi:hypothetical protein